MEGIPSEAVVGTPTVTPVEAPAPTIREQIQAKIENVKAKAAYDIAAITEAASTEVAALESHLAAGGTWLEMELHQLESWAVGVVSKLRAML